MIDKQERYLKLVIERDNLIDEARNELNLHRDFTKPFVEKIAFLKKSGELT